MKRSTSKYRVLVPTALFGTVRVTQGDVVRRELLGFQVRKLVEQGVVEAVVIAAPQRRVAATLL